MSTIKFVVEIDEQYVRDHSDPDKVSEKVKEGGKSEFMSGLMSMLGFSFIESSVNEGTTEFVVSHDNIEPKAEPIFEHTLANLACLAGILTRTRNDKKQGN